MMRATSNRMRFETARDVLGLSIAETAARMLHSPKAVESWLYDKRRDVPILAVLLIEEWASKTSNGSRLAWALDLVSSGTSLRAAVKQTGVHYETLRRAARRRGIKSAHSQLISIKAANPTKGV
jgi:hypothetical protein